MQLTHKPIRGTLALATASLFGAAAQPAQALDTSSDWEVDTAIMYYAEKDRVSLYEPVIRLRKDLGNDQTLTTRLIVDVLTGASANGAIPTSTAQTFTTPSGNATYTTGANSVPLDDTFHDTRGAVSLEWERPLGSATRAIYGLNFSTEFDYQSIGASATFNRDFNQKNSTFTAGLAFNADTVKPVGGAPVGLTNMPTYPTVKATQGDSLSKDVYDILLGWTQVLGRKDLMQFNYVYGNESGYLSDPYKILSVVDGVTGDLVADPSLRYVFEKRPEDRTRHALYSRWSHQFDEDVLHMSYRFYTDDWGIDSHTVDAKYRWELGSRSYLEPHLRYYTQSAADFYNTSLLDGESVQFASADYRLGDLTTTTLGLKYGYALSKQSELSLRVESITQSVDPSRVIGNQAQQDLTPDIEAMMVQASYILQF